MAEQLENVREGLGKGGREMWKRDRYHEKRLSSDRRTGLVRDFVWGLYGAV